MKRFFVALSALTIAASAACQTTERNLLVAVGGGQHQLFYKFNDGDKKADTLFSSIHNGELAQDWELAPINRRLP